MNVLITRQASTSSGTPGRLLATNAAGAAYACVTLELPWRQNQSGASCIVADSYRATIWHSDHLGCDVLRLEDKHGRKDCLVHPGNFAGDESLGFETQVHGCTLVGRQYGSLLNDRGHSQLAILESRVALTQLLAFIGAGEHFVEYRWAPGCAPADASTSETSAG